MFARVTPSLVTELKDLRVHDTAVSVCILIVSTLSLGFGASVGPEASLGAIGGFIGTIVGSSRLVRRLHGTRGARGYTVELYSLLGMAAAFGPLLPSPVLAVMLLPELGARDSTVAEQVAAQMTFARDSSLVALSNIEQGITNAASRISTSCSRISTASCTRDPAVVTATVPPATSSTNECANAPATGPYSRV